MGSPLKGVKPEGVWKYFVEIAQIPRCSGNEAVMTRYVLDNASQLGLEARSDRFGNVVVRKSASAGRESAPSVVLQGHLDMVCEKNKDKVHDFTRDPIKLVRRGNLLMADGTTLGADNGIAVATCLAIMEDRSLKHGPLEFLFTVDEETGLTGASNLGGRFLQSRTLMNLDSEEEGALYVGCAGGRDTVGKWKLAFENAPSNSVGVMLKVSGLKGGHSGLEIDKGRGNAIKLLNRVLLALDPLGIRLAGLEGGNKRNAIPREAEALLVLPKERRQEAENLVQKLGETFRTELASVDPGVTCTLEPSRRAAKVLKPRLQSRILRAIAGLPHGVARMSADLAGLVETSSNVAVVHREEDWLVLATSQRSSVASEIDEICQSVASIFRLAGAQVRHSDGYPGWKPDMSSRILAVAVSTFESLYGKKPEVKAIHAGLECGIIGEKYPGMDMVSLGPTLEEVHSPDERIHIDTVERFWDYLLAILANVV